MIRRESEEKANPLDYSKHMRLSSRQPMQPNDSEKNTILPKPIIYNNPNKGR